MATSSVFGLLADTATLISGRFLSILIFHRVVPEADPLFPGEMHARRFDHLLDRLKKSWEIVSLGAAIAELKAGSLRRRCLAITFDDGYSDNAEVAAPLLQRHGLPATVFVTTGYLGGGRMWNDTIIEAVRRTERKVLQLSFMAAETLAVGTIAERRQAISRLLTAVKHRPAAERVAACDEVAAVCAARLPDDLMMRPEQVRAIAQDGIEIGAHTVSHPILATLPDAEAQREIGQGKRELESLLDRPVGLFAYPNGRPQTDYLATHVKMVKEAGFDAAVSTTWGASGQGSDLFQLPRFTPWDEQVSRFNLRLVKNLFVRPR